MFDSFPNGLYLDLRFVHGLAGASFTKRSPHPFPDGQMFTPGKTLNVGHFGIGYQDLKPLTHALSIKHSVGSLI